MSIFFFMCSVLLFVSVVLFLLTTPLMMLFSFFVAAAWGVLSWYLFVNDVMSYMLYMVYLGGVLVLFIYVIILSSNYSSFPPISWWSFPAVVFLFLSITGYLYPIIILDGAISTITSIGIFSWSFPTIIILGGLLLYVFMYTCSNLRLGGRALAVVAASSMVHVSS
uniref:NADH dehydrogenase subunit 6 n=1 Tax=Cylindrus obtusus TaxID=649475 RepID=I1T1W8_9EUPU|nr:NADH dehydrogenase subunit 6 [Cylindrus obtusus]AEK48348.1 NADH dehydrogenase subunit 6 [Cylindrus obtusus]